MFEIVFIFWKIIVLARINAKFCVRSNIRSNNALYIGLLLKTPGIDNILVFLL